MARKFSLSPHDLSVVLRELRKLGFVESQKENRGGYRLISSPDQINLLQLHRSLAGASGDAGMGEPGAEVNTKADHWLRFISQRWSSDLACTSLADLM